MLASGTAEWRPACGACQEASSQQAGHGFFQGFAAAILCSTRVCCRAEPQPFPAMPCGLLLAWHVPRPLVPCTKLADAGILGDAC